MHRLIAPLILSLLLTGCWKSKSLTVLTETKKGEMLTAQIITETASRSDIPADIQARNVVAKIETKSGAKVFIVKKHIFDEPVVYKNEQAIKEGIVAVQPRDPWYKWPMIIGIVICAILLIWFWNQFKLMLGGIWSLLPKRK